jgi:hypothetical protein
MEQRRHRIAVLLVVVALHVPALLALRGLSQPRIATRPDRPLIVEFVLNEPAPPPSPPHRRTRESPDRRSRAGGNPGAKPRQPATATPRDSRLRGNDEPLDSRLRENDEPLASRLRANYEPVRLFAADGSLRISPGLADSVAAKPPAEGRDTFHIPAGDTWVLREPAAPIEFRDTMFSQVFLPEGMNPIEEACWRHKGLAFFMTMLGSQDCAAPGQKSRVPPPALIVYGVDDGAEIRRKTEAWARYDE